MKNETPVGMKANGFMNEVPRTLQSVYYYCIIVFLQYLYHADLSASLLEYVFVWPFLTSTTINTVVVQPKRCKSTFKPQLILEDLAN